MSDDISPKEVIRSQRASTKDGGRLIIQCDICKTLQHTSCLTMNSKSNVPKEYSCPQCVRTKKINIAKKPKPEKISKKPTRDSTSNACGVASNSSTSFSPVASTSSGKRYFHDQNLLYYGRLPTISRRQGQDEATTQRRSKGLRQAFANNGGLQELRDYMHALRKKIKTTGTRDMVRAYIWSDKWDNDDVKQEELKKEVANKRGKLNYENEQKKKEVKNDEKMDCEQDTPMKNEANENAAMEEPKIKVANEDAEMDCEGGGDINRTHVDTVLLVPARLLVDDRRMNLLANILNSQSQVGYRLQEYTHQIEDLNTDYPAGNRHDDDDDENGFCARMNSLINDMRTLKKFNEDA